LATQGTATGGTSMMSSNMGALTFSGPSQDGSGTATTTKPKAGAKAAAVASEGSFPGTPKNAQCPCGSGKKYKMCHGKGEA
jgi:preprotein translocase subunit SecA